MESPLGRTEIVVLLVAGGAAFAALVWCLVLGLASVVGGWRRLAGLYGDTTLFTGDVTRFASAQFGWASYSGALRVGASEMGLFLATVAIFRPFHPPLFIPWAEISAEPIASRFGSGVRLTFSSVPGVRVTLSGRAAARARPFLSSLATEHERPS
jgi:hypothetical protein